MNPLKTVFLGLSAAGLLFFGLSFGIDSLEPYTWYFALAAVAAISFVPDSRSIRTGFVTVVLAALVFFLTDFISSTSVGTKSFDLTEDDRYTLTDGTKAILSELTEPVTINYYVTRDVDGTPPNIKRHIPRVDNFLRELRNLAKDDLVTLNFIDPEPDTDEEDAAILDQVQPRQITEDDQMIFGASVSSLDKKTVIPFFDPATETQLEYSVISAIAEVTRRETPVVGLVSAHNMAMGGQSGQGWLSYQVLKRSYDLVDLGMMPTATLDTVYEARKWGDSPGYLDPEKIPVILLVHPAGITPEAEYTLDQYLLRGGTVIACVDPLSIAAQQSGRPQIPGMPPQGGTPPTSTLPKLFEKHNIKFDDQVVIDRTFAAANNPGILLLTEEAMTVKDDISLSSIQNLAFLLTGSFSGKDGRPMGPGLEVSRLVETSYKYTSVDGQSLMTREGAQQLRFALGSRRETDKKQSYIALLSGTFETAFPDGDPSAEKEEDSEEEKDQKPEEGEEEEKKEEKPAALATGTGKGNLYLIGDSDFLYDGMAYQFQRFGNSGFMQKVSGNAPFLMNILDQAVGSKHLIGARARTPIYRQFTVLKDLEAELEKDSVDTIKELREKEQEVVREVQEIQAKRTSDNSGQLTPESRERLIELRKAEIDARKAIRDEQKSYKSQTDSLKAGIFWRNLLYVPLGIVSIGLAVFVIRKRQTNAR
jgi:ABC-type uncharacterized transport system involved in gliding motility auxiliary subunit